jgi:methylglutaconyl-CoA hydratase
MENSFGMSVDDGTYVRLLQMHAAKRQARDAGEGLAPFAERRLANWALREAYFHQPKSLCVNELG